MSTEIIFVGNDNLVKVNGLQDELDDSYVNSLTGTSSMTDELGVEIATPSFAYVAASNGDYTANIMDTVAIVAGKCYELQITFDGGAGKKYVRTLSLKAMKRY